MSGRETVFAAIETALVATGAQEIERMPSGDPVDFDALHIIDNGQQETEAEAGSSRFALDITIEGYVEGAGGAAMHTRLNTLHMATVQAIIGLISNVAVIENVELGNLRVDVLALGSVRRLAFGQDFIITYAVKRGQS